MPSTNGSGPSREAWPRNAASTRPTKPIHFCRGPGDRSPSEQIVFCRGPFGGAHRLHEQVVRVNLLFIPLGRLSDEHRIYISETPILPFRHYFRLSSAKSHMNSVTYADPTRDFAPLRPGAVEVGLVGRLERQARLVRGAAQIGRELLDQGLGRLLGSGGALEDDQGGDRLAVDVSGTKNGEHLGGQALDLRGPAEPGLDPGEVERRQGRVVADPQLDEPLAHPAEQLGRLLEPP